MKQLTESIHGGTPYDLGDWVIVLATLEQPKRD